MVYCGFNTTVSEQIILRNRVYDLTLWLKDLFILKLESIFSKKKCSLENIKSLSLSLRNFTSNSLYYFALFIND